MTDDVVLSQSQIIDNTGVVEALERRRLYVF